MNQRQHDNIQFVITQLFSFSIYIIIVGIMFIKGLTVIHFWYALPVYFLLIFLQYWAFWKYKRYYLQSTFYVCNAIIFTVTMSIFFGVYFGIFQSTLSYSLIQAYDCSVIGRQSTGLHGIEKYSILYVDFKISNDNDHSMSQNTMLGYACASSNSEEPTGVIIINPQDFLTMDDLYTCGPIQHGESYRYTQRNLETQRYRLTYSSSTKKASQTRQSYKYCQDRYVFSEVKLPSWMCVPWNIDEEKLIEKQNCFVNFYTSPFSENTDKNKPYQNSLNREKLKESKEFAMILFNRLPIPLGGFMCFIVFVFQPMILSTNLFLSPIASLIMSMISKLVKQIQSFSYISQIGNKKILSKVCQKGQNFQSQEQLLSQQKQKQIDIIEQKNEQIKDIELLKHKKQNMFKIYSKAKTQNEINNNTNIINTINLKHSNSLQLQEQIQTEGGKKLLDEQYQKLLNLKSPKINNNKNNPQRILNANEIDILLSEENQLIDKRLFTKYKYQAKTYTDLNKFNDEENYHILYQNSPVLKFSQSQKHL